MRSIAKKSIAILSAVGIAGIGSVFFGAAPASADPTCTDGGSGLTPTYIGNGICELTISTADTPTYFYPDDMTDLEVLLVGGGGTGAYGGGGGGGQVRIIDFDNAEGRFVARVGSDEQPTTINNTLTTFLAKYGTDGTNAGTLSDYKVGSSGVSGSGHKGYPEAHIGGGGGGAKASPTSRYNGGAGLKAESAPIVDSKGKTVIPRIPLFAGDTNCYGGGGAIASTTKAGTLACNGGGFTTGDVPINAVDNTGGGGGSFLSDLGYTTNGADGVIVLRWNANPDVTLSFNDGARGHTPKSEHLIGGMVPTKPTNPKVSGYKFLGWYTDAAFATPADFTVSVDADTTFYGKFAKS